MNFKKNKFEEQSFQYYWIDIVTYNCANIIRIELQFCW